METIIKKTYSNFMGSGDGYLITYVDKEHKSILEFEFNKGDPNSDKREEFLSNIILKRQLD